MATRKPNEPTSATGAAPLAAVDLPATVAAAKASAAATAADRPVSRAGAKVTIACKVGVAWVDLQLCDKREFTENTQTGPRLINKWVRVGRIVRIRGTAYPRGEAPEGFPEKPQMVGGYALTHNVDAEFWDKWLDQNGRSPMVLSGMIFASERIDEVKGMALEHKDELSGLEPIARGKQSGKDTLTDARLPRSSLRGSVSELEPGERPSAA